MLNMIYFTTKIGYLLSIAPVFHSEWLVTTAYVSGPSYNSQSTFAHITDNPTTNRF